MDRYVCLRVVGARGGRGGRLCVEVGRGGGGRRLEGRVLKGVSACPRCNHGSGGGRGCCRAEDVCDEGARLFPLQLLCSLFSAAPLRLLLLLLPLLLLLLALARLLRQPVLLGVRLALGSFLGASRRPGAPNAHSDAEGRRARHAAGDRQLLVGRDVHKVTLVVLVLDADGVGGHRALGAEEEPGDARPPKRREVEVGDVEAPHFILKRRLDRHG
mmetsp:Transcript_33463/g.78442  ORF Transcript_33463/g.78442 Transcript_33463/m.78442 type:complete len:215 (-) Transcript_33463:49-693(-)